MLRLKNYKVIKTKDVYSFFPLAEVKLVYYKKYPQNSETCEIGQFGEIGQLDEIENPVKSVFFNIDNFSIPKKSKELIHWLQKKHNIVIWLNMSYKLFYSINNSKILTTTPKKLSLILHQVTKKNIFVKEKPAIENNEYVILISDLELVHGEKFNLSNSLFFTDQGKKYKNTKTLTPVMLQSMKCLEDGNGICFNNKSIILQYIYYLSNYNKDRFEYIINWFISMIKGHSYPPLVLLGKKESGTEIFFDYIIKPIIGNDYCVKIQDYNLQSSTLQNSIINKICINLNNISHNAVKKKHIKDLLYDVMYSKSMYITQGSSKRTEEIAIYSQTLITITQSELPYMDKNNTNYTLFNVPDNIEDMYVPSWHHNGERLDKSQLIHEIKNNMNDFLNLLFFYKNKQTKKLFIDDDKEFIFSNEEEELKLLCNAIVNKDIEYFTKVKNINPSLYEELIKDFNQDRIKQSNINQCFKILSNQVVHSKTLMTELRNINLDFFHVRNLKGSNKSKYYHYL